MKSLIFILAITFLMGCQEKSTVQGSLTEIDRLVIQSDTASSENPLGIIQAINKEMKDKWPSIKEYVSPLEDRIDTTGLVKYKFYSGTINRKNVNLTIVAYRNPKLAATAFSNYVNAYKCCIPENDLTALKNFQDLKSFKQGSSKIVYSDNTIATMTLGKKISDNQEFSKFLQQFFSAGKLIKLETEDNGPALWTRK